MVVYKYPLTCLTGLSSETVRAVACAGEATTTILTLWGAYRRRAMQKQHIGEVFWSLINSNHMPSNKEREPRCRVFATVAAMVVQGMSLYNMVLIDMNLGK